MLHCSEPSAIDLSVPQAKSELQQSRREVIEAATSLAEVLFDKYSRMEAGRLNSRKEARQTLLI